MPRRGGSVHVATIKTKGKGERVYTSQLLRRSYREDGKVKHENLGNLSHLPAHVIDVIRSSLAGRELVDLDEALSIERSLPHGHVAAVLGVLRGLDLERLICRDRCRERDLVVAMVTQRLIGPGSKLSATRRFGQTTLASELGLGEVKEAELLGAMDWLLARQERIEKALAKRHLAGEGFMLYDLSSSYVEGRCCPLASLGYSRDRKRGTAQVNYGLTCSPEGRPVAIEVHDGSTQDQQTLPGAVEAARERFAIKDVVVVGDRGMLTKAHAAALTEAGVEFVSALKSAQIRALVESGDLQLGLFDETNLAEISSDQFPGERLVVCRNPAVAAERKRKRGELLAATEAELDKVRAMVEGERGTLRNADAGKIGTRAGKVLNKFKVAKHFELRIADGAFSYARKEEQIKAEASLDGLYVIRTTCPETKLTSSASVVRTYKQLKMAERAFRTMKDQIEIRPIHHHLEERVRAHAFICMLAYYVAFELHTRLAALLFTDTEPLSPADPVAAAERSTSAKAKAGSTRTSDGYAAHSFEDLIAELGTLCRNELRFGDADHTFARLTKPTDLQTRALEMLDVKLHK
ncbi:MAG: IS1634 family transposase [Actinobacteria bacterium]|nr:IS1634 family transposase [Actinomycetota bacterium]MCA1700392.1 IS1634 family transposase [Actinomycetota bacterium]